MRLWKWWKRGTLGPLSSSTTIRRGTRTPLQTGGKLSARTPAHVVCSKKGKLQGRKNGDTHRMHRDQENRARTICGQSGGDACIGHRMNNREARKTSRGHESWEHDVVQKKILLKKSSATGRLSKIGYLVGAVLLRRTCGKSNCGRLSPGRGTAPEWKTSCLRVGPVIRLAK